MSFYAKKTADFQRKARTNSANNYQLKVMQPYFAKNTF